MKRTITLVLLAVFAVSMACEKPTTFEDVDPKVVVVSEFTPNRPPEVLVYLVRSIFQDSAGKEYLLDADVHIYHQKDSLTSLFLNERSVPPFYTSDNFIPSPNTTYTIQVAVPGFDSLTAESRIPNPIQIQQLEVTDLKLEPGQAPEGKEFNFRANIHFQDPVEEVNYYHINFTQQILEKQAEDGDSVLVEIRRENAQFSALNNDVFITAQRGGVLFSDETFNGKAFMQSFPMRFDLEPGEVLGNLLVELRAVSPDYYFFQTDLTKQNGPGNPFQGDTPVYNNIHNGRGIFAGYNFSVDSIAVIR